MRGFLLDSTVDTQRSLQPIDDNDLQRLATLGLAQLQAYIAREPVQRGRFADLHIATVLCQGAGLHYLDGTTGVKDFDLCHFFRADGGLSFPHRTIWTADFSPSKFGRDPNETAHYTGRRIDIQGRSITVPDDDALTAIRTYLGNGVPNTTPWHFAQKGMVAIHPPALRGAVVWPAPHA